MPGAGETGPVDVCDVDDAPAAAARRARLFDAIAREPWRHDFHAVLREIDALSRPMPRLGRAPRPAAEAVRLGQDPELDFAPAALMSFAATAAGVPRLGVRFFGLFGPMGALPLHLTEYARDRLRNHADPTFARFADLFHHRALLLFHRAWAQSQPAVQADRPDDDRFAEWVNALGGHAGRALRGADSVPDAARRHLTGPLARATRNPESIRKVLRHYFGVPVRVEPNVGHWLALRPEDRTRLGRPGVRRSAPLGVSAVAGARVWDRQYKLRLHVGPLTLDEYRRFLSGCPSLVELRDWMRRLVGFELVWDARLVLRAAEVPALCLGNAATPPAQRQALGRSTWLGRGQRRGEPPRPHAPHGDRADLRLSPARIGTARSTSPDPSGDHDG